MNSNRCHSSLNRKRRSLMALAVICAAFFLLSGNAPASDSSGVADHDVQAILAEMTQDAGPPTTPFAGQSLNEIAAVLARRYANKTPVAWGEHLPGVISTLTLPLDQDSGPVIALTLDACGGRKGASYDAELIAMLRQWEIPATLFVTSLWIRNNPETLAELAADPLFEIAAHGSRHYPCFVTGKTVYDIRGTASFAELVVEVEGNARDIERATGRRPRWFRAGTAYYDDLAVQAIRDMGLNIAGYSIAGDEGATLSTARVKAKVLSAKHGDILLLHMNKPHSGTREGLRQSLPLLLEQGASFVRLSDEK